MLIGARTATDLPRSVIKIGIVELLAIRTYNAVFARNCVSVTDAFDFKVRLDAIAIHG